jgi:CBS domain-containing membrane protein
MFQVKDIMTEDVFTLRETDSLSAARDLMNLARIRHIPIVNENDAFVGLVTHRDILAAAVSKLADIDSATREEIEASIPVREIMQREVTTTTENISLKEAATILLRGKFGCLPVLRQGKLIGIITEADFLRLTIQLLEATDMDDEGI